MRGGGRLKRLEWLVKITNEIGPIHGNKAFQKIVYFAQHFGVNLHYDFKWSLYGPYSRQLASELTTSVSLGFLSKKKDWRYHLGKMAKLFKNMKDIEEKEINALKITKQFVKKRSPLQLELLASMHFLWNEAYLPLKQKEKVFEILETMKPLKFSEPDKEKAWEYLVEQGLISSN